MAKIKLIALRRKREKTYFLKECKRIYCNED